MTNRTPPAKTPVAATPMAFVRAMVSGCHRLGHDPQAALAGVGITDRDLYQLDGRITAAQMERLSDQLMRELDDEALGWFSRKFPWGSYGMLARASLTAPNLQVALQRWCRHHNLLTSDVSLSVEHTFQESAIALREVNAGSWLAGELKEFCHVSLLRNLIGFGSWLVDSQIPLRGVEMSLDRPHHQCAYTTLFKATVSFGAPYTKLLIDTKYISLPIRRNESDLNRMLQRALPLTVHHYRPDRLLPERVRHLLSSAPASYRNAGSISADLGVSVRTLHRQLAAHQTSLQDLKDAVRMEHALALLLRTDQQVKAVASSVGFESQKAFSRAFKRQTGQTPGQVKKQPTNPED